MIFTVFGGFVAAETLPAPEITRVSVGGVLTIRPIAGWELSRRDAVPFPTASGDRPAEFAQLTRGSGALDLLAIPDVGETSVDLAIAYRDGILAGQLERLSVSDELEPIVLGGGLEALQFHYIGSMPGTGAAIEGSVVVAVSASGNGVVFDGWAFQGQLELIAEELVTMIDGAKVA
jgi:hypothetical protein